MDGELFNCVQKIERVYKMFKKKITRLITLSCVVFLSLMLVGCSYFFKNDSIFVTGYTQGKDVYFAHMVDNVRISATGRIYKFKTDVAKVDLFSEFSRCNEVFEETPNSVSVIYDNEIFTLKELADDNYILYGEYIIFEEEYNVYCVPFPTSFVSNASVGEPRMKFGDFKVENLSYEYLEHFYSVYPKINLHRNKIICNDLVLELVIDTDSKNGMVKISHKHTGDGSVSW